MASTLTNPLPLGTQISDFTLLNVINNRMITLNTYAPEQPLVIVFMSNHCHFVKHIIHEFVHTATEFQAKGIGFIAICPSDIEHYPEDAPEAMHAFATLHHFSFPYCSDPTQQVAKQFHAICTPEIYVLDKHHVCIYHGRFDDSRPNHSPPVTGHDLITALNCILTNQPIPEPQIPGLGCTIKWKKC